MNGKANTRTGSYVLSMASEGIARFYFYDVKYKLIEDLSRHVREHRRNSLSFFSDYLMLLANDDRNQVHPMTSLFIWKD